MTFGASSSLRIEAIAASAILSRSAGPPEAVASIRTPSGKPGLGFDFRGRPGTGLPPVVSGNWIGPGGRSRVCRVLTSASIRSSWACLASASGPGPVLARALVRASIFRLVFGKERNASSGSRPDWRRRARAKRFQWSMFASEKLSRPSSSSFSRSASTSSASRIRSSVVDSGAFAASSAVLVEASFAASAFPRATRAFERGRSPHPPILGRGARSGDQAGDHEGRGELELRGGHDGQDSLGQGQRPRRDDRRRGDHRRERAGHGHRRGPRGRIQEHVRHRGPRLPRERRQQDRGGEPDAAPFETAAEQVAGAGEPAPDRADGPAEFPRRLLVRPPLEVTKDDRRAVRLREAVDLSVDRGRGRPADRGPRRRSRRARGRRRAGRSRLADSARDRRATRRATPWSQGPSRSRWRTDPARFTSTRKVAWKASSTSLGSRSRDRQTARTIGPWRATMASKAASSRRATKRSRSWPSPRPATVPWPKSRPSWRQVDASCMRAMRESPMPDVFPPITARPTAAQYGFLPRFLRPMRTTRPRRSCPGRVVARGRSTRLGYWNPPGFRFGRWAGTDGSALALAGRMNASSSFRASSFEM